MEGGVLGSDATYGHTGVVIKVDDDGTIHTIETGNGSPVFERSISADKYKSGVTFINLKPFLKEQQ